jgi:hypothetical protein
MSGLLEGLWAIYEDIESIGDMGRLSCLMDSMALTYSLQPGALRALLYIFA